MDIRVWEVLGATYFHYFLFSLFSGVGVAVLNGLLYAVGGFDSENRLATAEAYNMETNMWEYVSPMHTARSGEAVAALNG